MYQVAPPLGVPPGGEARIERLIARALEVFGDDDAEPVWWHHHNAALGFDLMGQTLTPVRLAAQSEEGLRRLLCLLDELAPTITLRWKPELAKRRGRGTRGAGRGRPRKPSM